MNFENLRKRLDKIESRKGLRTSGLGRFPAVRIVTRSDEDRAQQLAALTAAGEYEPDRFLIEFRIVSPDPRMKELDRELRRLRPPLTAH